MSRILTLLALFSAMALATGPFYAGEAMGQAMGEAAAGVAAGADAPAKAAAVPAPQGGAPDKPQGPPDRRQHAEFVNTLGMRFVQVPAGSFLMGASDLDTEFYEHEKPQHRVDISKPFRVGVLEVSQWQWQQVMGNNPSRFKDPLLPVESVSYDSVMSFIAKLNEREGTHAYRLPTEAEWEYFARAGTMSPYFFGDSDARLGDYAWYRANSERTTHPGGLLRANPWGLHDVYGNVAEMLSDWFGLDYYTASPQRDPKGPSEGKERSLRGGSWTNTEFGNRSSYRDRYEPDYLESVVGLRLVMDLPSGDDQAKR
ncbi:MAG: formylglycine-generating enzyme family protein [Deltaproteobacteria bacterium]|jgi:formylglycine-generating enzyme required for sulfatase activity|nr:formylglycine-generating enzyme family protein [Deltaproteobacteria bacterium]